MDVYFNGNFWGHPSNEIPLKRTDINHSFNWHDINGKIAAIYTGNQGIVVDICQYVETEKITQFMQKWKDCANVDNITYEQQQTIQLENPMCTDFKINLTVNGHKLENRNGSSGIFWYPEMECDDKSSELLSEYNCDKNYAWGFSRTSFAWDKAPLEPRTIIVDFIAEKVQIYGAHFTTKLNCDKHTVTIKNPATSKEYELTIKSLEPVKYEINQGFPNNCHILKYTVNPEISSNELRLADANQGNNGVITTPQSDDTAAISFASQSDDGPTSTFLACRISAPKSDSDTQNINIRTAYSSMYNDIKDQIEWSPIFDITRRENMQISIEI